MTVSPFALCVLAISILAALGLPIGHAMIASSILYLLLTGADLGTAAEQILNGLFNGYVLLAIPLFILAADLMNIGSLTDRLLQFCLVLVGRFRGGLGHVNRSPPRDYRERSATKRETAANTCSNMAVVKRRVLVL